MAESSSKNTIVLLIFPRPGTQPPAKIRVGTKSTTTPPPDPRWHHRGKSVFLVSHGNMSERLYTIINETLIIKLQRSLLSFLLC